MKVYYELLFIGEGKLMELHATSQLSKSYVRQTNCYSYDKSSVFNKVRCHFIQQDKCITYKIVMCQV